MVEQQAGVSAWETWSGQTGGGGGRGGTLTRVTLGYCVDTGGAEHAHACSPSVLHAHAHAQKEGRHRPHQEHDAKHDPGDRRAPETHIHTHTHNNTRVSSAFMDKCFGFNPQKPVVCGQ